MEKPEAWEPWWDEDYVRSVSKFWVWVYGIGRIIVGLGLPIYFLFQFEYSFWFMSLNVLFGIFFLYFAAVSFLHLKRDWVFCIVGNELQFSQHRRNLMIVGKSDIFTIQLDQITGLEPTDYRNASLPFRFRDASYEGGKVRPYRIVFEYVKGGPDDEFRAFFSYRIAKAKGSKAE